MYVYYNATYQRNRDEPHYLPGSYSTDVVADTAVEFLEDAASHKDRPFFLNVMPIGPHFERAKPIGDDFVGATLWPPVPAKRHEKLFPNATVPRTENFNPATVSYCDPDGAPLPPVNPAPPLSPTSLRRFTQPGAVSYLKNLPRLNQTVVDYLDYFYRRRLQTLQAVDDLVDSVMDKLEELDLLDNTYIIYTSDNGFHIGNHRMNAGKTTCYEEDVNIPLYIRGPGVPKNERVHYPTTHIDLVPTIFKLAGIPPRPDFDGTPMPVTKDMKPTKPEHVNIEFWGFNYDEGEYARRKLTVAPKPGIY